MLAVNNSVFPLLGNLSSTRQVWGKRSGVNCLGGKGSGDNCQWLSNIVSCLRRLILGYSSCFRVSLWDYSSNLYFSLVFLPFPMLLLSSHLSKSLNKSLEPESLSRALLLGNLTYDYSVRGIWDSLTYCRGNCSLSPVVIWGRIQVEGKGCSM